MLSTCFGHSCDLHGLQYRLYHRSAICVTFQHMHPLRTSLHQLRTTVSNFWHFGLVAVVLCCWTANFGQRLYDCNLWSDLDTFDLYLYHVLTTLKMATWEVETCRWPLCNKLTAVTPKCVCWHFDMFCKFVICLDVRTWSFACVSEHPRLYTFCCKTTVQATITAMCVDWQYCVNADDIVLCHESFRTGHHSSSVKRIRSADVAFIKFAPVDHHVHLCHQFTSSKMYVPRIPYDMLPSSSLCSKLPFQRACLDIIFCLQPALRSTTPVLLESIGFFRKDPGP